MARCLTIAILQIKVTPVNSWPARVYYHIQLRNATI